jgi:hypothetical protein
LESCIGNSNISFSGTFVGQGHIISNLTFYNSTLLTPVNIVFFDTNTGYITNLQLTDISITGTDVMGGFCANNIGGKISKCCVIGGTVVPIGTASATEVFLGTILKIYLIVMQLTTLQANLVQVAFAVIMMAIYITVILQVFLQVLELLLAFVDIILRP